MICTRCKLDKPTTEFHKLYGGFQPGCKECKSKYQKESREKDKEAFNKRKHEHTEKRRKRAQNFVANYLNNHPCIDCNEKDIIVLDFDHRSDKSFNVAQMIGAGYKVETIVIEIAKCDIRCANCHRRKTAKEFNWWKHALLVNQA